jgi:hypothetical protein
VIEPIFGIFKRQWDLDYTILKTKEKVLTKYRIAGLAYNLMPLVTEKGQNWAEKRLKKLYLYTFELRIIHKTSQQLYIDFLPLKLTPPIITHIALFHHQNRVVA